jgi:hypothetical protein
MSGFADDYIEVPERMAQFFARYPDGSLQSDPPTFVTADGKEWVIFRCMAYRTPDDARPGVGTAWELIPGRTPYTKTSEVQNGETSAWGRALAAIGFVSKKIATAHEVRMAQSRQEDAEDLIALVGAAGTDEELRALWGRSVGVPGVHEAILARRELLGA